ncbi:MAG: zinc metallopeptidase [Microthrixaceae bacterium]|nr:zinc metallopeptidase [Microthrixaceae bacterium]
MEFDEAGDPGDLIDRRGEGGLGASGGGLGGLAGVILGGMLAGRRRKAGGGMGMMLLLIVGFLVMRSCGAGGFDLGAMSGLDQLPGLPGATPGQQLPATGNPTEVGGDDPQAADVSFANAVVTDANDVWSEQFRVSGQRYNRTKIVLFSGGVNSGCGAATAAVGPFYCPADSLVYLDLTFWDELANRFGAGGDFAQAYVIAHEVGHHVQNELGISSQVRKIEEEDPEAATGADGLSVRVELQADCLAGVWAHTTYERKLLDEGDIEEAMAAAQAVGDDTIQRSTVGRVRPDTFTHGSAEQRRSWFRRGFKSGSSEDCDTFSAETLED